MSEPVRSPEDVLAQVYRRAHQLRRRRRVVRGGMAALGVAAIAALVPVIAGGSGSKVRLDTAHPSIPPATTSPSVPSVSTTVPSEPATTLVPGPVSTIVHTASPTTVAPAPVPTTVAASAPGSASGTSGSFADVCRLRADSPPKYDAFGGPKPGESPSPTTCGRSADGSAYLVPRLFVDGQPVRPSEVFAYYLTGNKPGSGIRAFPSRLMMMVGDLSGTSSPKGKIDWGCGPDSPIVDSDTVPTCPAPHKLEVHIRFPDCWDGKNLDSTNHESHMAYSAGGTCPSDHPVPVPRLFLGVKYPTSGGSGVTTSFGGPAAMHGVFVNQWDQPTLEALVRGCLGTNKACGQGGP